MEGEQTLCPTASSGGSQLPATEDNMQQSFLQQQHHHNHHDHKDDAVAAPTSIIAPPATLPPRRVDHTYRDFSNFPIDELPAARKRSPTNFPSKLHQILSNPEYAHIICWMPHGRAWKIHNKELLIQDIVPKYFVQSKYESFTRQLNGWGFKRLHQSGNDFNAFYHECFLKGMPHLTVLMKRVPPNQGKLLPHVEGEPNFYEIDQHFPLPPRSGNNNINNSNANTVMSSMMMPSAAAYGGGAPPYFHPQQHHPAAYSSSFFPGTGMSYPSSTRGDYQQHQGQPFGIMEPPFSAPNFIGHHPSTTMMGGLFPPPQSAYPNPSLNDSMMYRHVIPPPLRPSSFVQDTLCCVGNDSSGANSGTNRSNQCE